MHVYFNWAAGMYMIQIEDELLEHFGSIAEIRQAHPAEFAAAFPDGLDTGEGGNVTHQISQEGPA